MVEPGSAPARGPERPAAAAASIWWLLLLVLTLQCSLFQLMSGDRFLENLGSNDHDSGSYYRRSEALRSHHRGSGDRQFHPL